MPDSLFPHAGERIDLEDLIEAATTYTQESNKFAFERAWLDRRSRILDGFRVRIEDQTSFPGLITVYNGNALDRDGQLTNNEQAMDDSRSITLLGSTLNFYVEIEFVQNPSNIDTRFFWDPTVENVAPEPDGSEFSLNIATRYTPDWRIVSPVSTTGFQQTATPGSVRVPVGVFRTDGSNRVSTGGTNPGLVLVRAASVLEQDVLATGVSLRVADARVFPSTLPFTITVDFGAGSAESRTVTSIDREHGIFGISAGLTSDHSAGAIIRVTSGNADLVREKDDPSDPALSSAASPPNHPDLAQRLWQANEVRGSALIPSKEAFGDRNDLNLRSLKDYVDFLSAQIRELKFGSPRPEIVNTSPPITFSTRPRYFDAAGGVLGARTNTLSIGNGSTTFGDFNGTDGDVVFAAAIAALPSTGGTIFIKAGTYTFSTTVTLSKKITFVGEGVDSVILSSDVAGAPMLSVTSETVFENLTLQKGTGAVGIIEAVASVLIFFDHVNCIGQFIADDGFTPTIKAYNTNFTASGSNTTIVTLNNSVLTNSEFLNCKFTTTASPCFLGDFTALLIQSCTVNAERLIVGASTNSWANIRIAECTMVLESSLCALSGDGTLDGFIVSNSNIIITDLPASTSIFFFTNTDITDHITLSNLIINVAGGTSSSGSPSFGLSIQSNSSTQKLTINNVDLNAYPGSFIIGILIDQDTLVGRVELLNSQFFRTQEMLRLGGATGALDTGNVLVENCTHDNQDEHATVYGIRLVSNPTLSNLEVLNTMFMNYRLNGSTGVRIGIDTTTTNTTEVRFVVKNCTFENIGYGSSSTAAGVFYDASTASNMPHTFDVHNNRFLAISSNTTGLSVGVYIVSSATTNRLRSNITGNYIATIGEATSTSGAAYGVFIANASDDQAATTISGNHIVSVISSSAAAAATGISLDDCNNVVVSENYISNVNSPGVTSLLNGCSIRITGGGLISNVSVINNRVDQSTSTTASEGTYNINLINTQMNTWRIIGNIVKTSTNCVVGIFVDGTSAGAVLVDGKIDNNTVYFRDTAGTSSRYGIRCVLGGASYGVTVDGNTIEETTLHATASLDHIGISVHGNTTGGDTYGLSVSNNVLTAPKTGSVVSSTTRIGIRVDAVAQTKVNGNLVSWNEPSVLEGSGIVLTSSVGGTWSGHIVSGNYVRADDDAAVGSELLIVTANMINGFLDANQFGESDGGGSPTGLITPAAAAGGWVYGDNMI